MSDPSQLLEGLYDPSKVQVPRRFQRKMPSFKHLKGNPCMNFWTELVNCYSLHNFEAHHCAPQMFAYEECTKSMKQPKARVAAARFYVKTVLRGVQKAARK